MYEGKTLVVVFCMHRSGSSLVTQVLQRLGMSLGPFELLGASAHNKYGHFEAIPFYRLDQELQGQAFGFIEDLPASPDLMRRFCRCEGRWEPDWTAGETAIQHGKQLIELLVQSGPVSGFKDPRVPLLWPFWSRVLSCFPGLRVVLLLLARSPHEIAMSIFMRGEGVLSYQDALDATAVHFKRMIAIEEGWEGQRALIRFDPSVLPHDLRQAVEICGLVWRDEVLAEVYDASCKHHQPAVVAHEAQDLFERLSRLPAAGQGRENLAQIQADAALREGLTRAQFLEIRRQHAEAQRHYEQSRSELVQAQEQLLQARQELVQTQEQLAQSRQQRARFRLELEELRQATVRLETQLALMQASRFWKLRELVVSLPGLRRVADLLRQH